MVANPLTAQIAPAAVESFAGQAGRRPAGPLFDALMAVDAGPAVDPTMDSIRKSRGAIPAVFPWMLPLNSAPSAAQGSAEAEVAPAIVAIAGSPPPAVVIQAGPVAAEPVSPIPPGSPAPASTLISEMRSAGAEEENDAAPLPEAPGAMVPRGTAAVAASPLLDAVQPALVLPEQPAALRRLAGGVASQAEMAPDAPAAEPGVAEATPEAAAQAPHAARPGPATVAGTAEPPVGRRAVAIGNDSAAPTALHEPAAASRLAGGLEPARPSLTAPSPEPRPPTPALQIAATLAKGLHGAPARLVVDLVPRDLGRVEIAIETEKRGGRARITADRRETLDLLVAEARVLEKALADAGVDLGRRGLEFALRGEAGRGDGGRGRDPQAPAERAVSPGGSGPAGSSAPLAEPTLPRSRTGLDILV
jgi:hypothetical protein